MRCVCCNSFSFFMFCKNCLNILGETSLRYRQVDDLRVYYFYNYSDISKLLFSKHKMHGSSVYKTLAKLTFTPFAKKLSLENCAKITALGLDDNVKSGYSHSAILAKALKNEQIIPLFNALRAQNNVKYAGKSLEFRRKNPRGFKLLKEIKNPVILVDDIITTGTSLNEAKSVLERSGCQVLFGLVLADARE